MLLTVQIHQLEESLMDQEEFSLQKKFRHFEWISICLLGVAQYAWVCYAVQFDQLIAISFALLGLELFLAAIVPKSTGWRFLLLSVQTILLSASCALGIHQRSSLYFLVLGAKAAILLPRKQMLIVSAILLSGRILAGTISQHLHSHFHIHRTPVPEFYNWQILETEGKLYFTIALLTVLFLGRTLVAERRSRKTQQELAKEAQRLAIDFERNKIAVNIHERLGHILASQLIQLELAARLVQEKQFEKATARVSQSYDLAVQCLQDLRQAVTSMRKESEDSGATVN